MQAYSSAPLAAQPACKALAPRYQRLAADWPHISFAEVCHEDNVRLVKELGVRMLPSVQIVSVAGELSDILRVPANRMSKLEETLQTYADGAVHPVEKVELLQHLRWWTRRWQRHRWRRALLWERPLSAVSALLRPRRLSVSHAA